MNALTSFVEITGWTLLHFLWQGTAIAVLLWVILRLARRAGPQVRYAAAFAALLLMVASVGGTAVWLAGGAAPTPASMVPLPDREMPAAPDRAYRSYVPYTPHSVDVPPAPTASNKDTPSSPAPTVPAANTATAPIPAALPWGVGAWVAGVAFFSLRLLLGWRMARRWRRTGSEELPEEWRTRFAELCEAMRLSRPVWLLSSATLAVPVVVGWLRPVVLVPASLLTGLPASQLTAILAHELAHVRRHDYLVNLLQCLAETLFFYHPAVWWVSSVMRREREHCCDDIATALCGGALDYARALTALEEFRALPAAGLSAAGGPLLQRIRRLAGLPEERASAWPAVLLAVAGLCLIPILRGGEDPGGDKDTKSPASPASSAVVEKDTAKNEAAAPTAPRDQEAEERRAFDTVHSFLTASSSELKVRHHDLTQEALPKLKAYYERHPAKAFGNPKLLKCEPTAPGRWKLMVEIAEIPEPQIFEVFEKEGKLLVDWESASLYQRDYYSDLQKDRPKAPVPLLAVCEVSDYYNDPFADAQKFQCYRLTYPGVDPTLYGYATRDSDLAKTISRLPNKSLRLEVKYPELPVHANLVEIVKVAIPGMSAAESARLRFETELKLSTPAAVGGAGKADQTVIHVEADGRIKMDSKTLTLDELGQQLAEVAKADNKRAIVIRGGRTTPFDRIVKVLDIVYKAGLTQVSFATTQPEPKPPAAANGVKQSGEDEAPKGKLMLNSKLPGDFSFTKNSHYPPHVVVREDGSLESGFGELTEEDRVKIPQTAAVMTDSQGEHEIIYGEATLTDGTLRLQFKDSPPAYHGSLSVSVAPDQTFTTSWDFNPIIGPKFSTRVVAQKLTLDHWPPAAGKRVRGSIDVVLANKLPSGEEKQFYIRGLFDTPVNSSTESTPENPDEQDKGNRKTGQSETVSERKFTHTGKDGTYTDIVLNGKGVREENTYNRDGVLNLRRVFQTDRKGRLRNGVIYDGKANPLSSVWFGFDRKTDKPREEQHYNKKGQLIRRLFYPGTLPNRPDLADRFMAINYNPDDRNTKPVVELDAVPTTPLSPDPPHLQKSRAMLEEARKLKDKASAEEAQRKERLDDAFRLLVEAITPGLHYDKEDKGSAPNRALMAEIYLEMGGVMMMSEDAVPGKNHLIDASVAMGECVKLYSGLAKEHPKDSLWTVSLARCYYEVASLMRKRKSDKEAPEYESAARKYLATLKATGPHSEEVMAEIAALEKLLSKGQH